jgi:hypothetical protein
MAFASLGRFPSINGIGIFVFWVCQKVAEWMLYLFLFSAGAARHRTLLRHKFLGYRQRMTEWAIILCCCLFFVGAASFGGRI